jgi:hypothetical protein
MFCLIGTFKIINVTTSFLNTHLKISRINEYFCLAVSVNLRVKNLRL